MVGYEQNIVLDLEFTPVFGSERTPSLRFEIIQIGAVRINPEGELIDSFVSYVKPQFVEYVAHYVRRLTGIKSSDLTRQQPIEVVLEKFREWVGSSKTRFVTWSSSDLLQLTDETANKGIAFPEKDGRWLDLQRIYPRLLCVDDGNSMSLAQAAEWYGISASKKKCHNALYDARLTAQLLSSLLTKDYLIQREFLHVVVPDAAQSSPTTFSIGDKFSALFQLKQELETTASVSVG